MGSKFYISKEAQTNTKTISTAAFINKFWKIFLTYVPKNIQKPVMP